VRELRRKHTRRETGRRAGLRRRSPRPQPDTMPYNVPRPTAELEPATLHVPNWLSSAHQHQLLRLWASTLVRAGSNHLAPGANPRCSPARTVVLVGDDALNSRDAVCDEMAARLPSWLTDVAQTAAREAHGPERRARFRPDLGLLTYLAPGARVSIGHTADLFDGPIVNLGFGADCIFRLHDRENRGRAYTERRFCSGDLLVLTAESSAICLGHGYVAPGTDRPATGLTAGRLSLTLGVARHAGPRRDTA
jgi:alkylated DNA repair dioxygenase AlkB